MEHEILIAAENGPSIGLLQRLLTRNGYRVMAVRDGFTALATLTGPRAPRLAVLDAMLPGLDGLQVCRRIRSADGSRNPYLILLTEPRGREDRLLGLRGGADDYLAKPVDGAELLARVAIGNRLVGLQAALERASSHDTVTGLANRATGERLLDREVNRARRARTPLAVVMADVDHFRLINDQYGYGAGNQVLRAIATRLQGVLRETDEVVRWGGEEILVVLPGTGAPAAAEVAERLRQAVAEFPVLAVGQPVPVTASFGVAAAEVDDWLEGAALVEAAERALDRAKSDGRNRVEGAPAHAAGAAGPPLASYMVQ
jgi:diguanylate cyclase (GGDEF)-like protein